MRAKMNGTQRGGRESYPVSPEARRIAYCLRSLFLGRNLLFFSKFLLTVLFILSSSEGFALSPLSGFNPADLAETPNGIFLEGSAFTADTARMPIVGLLRDDWGSPGRPQDMNRASAYWDADAGAVYRGWRLAGFHRGEFLIKANRDTLDFLRMINLKEDLPTGRAFEVSLTADGFSAKGVEVSKGISIFKGLNAGVTARYLSGEMVQAGSLSGSVTATSPTTYDFSFLIDYDYDRNLVYPRKATPGTGNGYSFDIGLRYSAGKVFSAGVLFRDILGRIYWKNVPYTTATAVSKVMSFDSSGYQQYRPTIQGFEGYRDFTQKIPLKVDIDLSGSLGPLTISPKVNIMNGRPLYWVFLGYKATRNTSFNAGYNANFKTYSLGATYKNSLLSVYTSHIDPSKAASLGISLLAWYEW